MFKQEALERYFQTANERHRIYLKRQAGEPWPWIDDPIFQKYKFTNCYRQLDNGTQWLTKNWIEPYADHPMLFFNICLYRQFNWVGTAEFLGFQKRWNADEVYDDLKFYKVAKLDGPRRLYTNAHMVRGPRKSDGFKEKLRYTIYCVLDQLYTNQAQFIPQNGDNLQAAFNRLIKAHGYGGFGAYEVISDLRWTHYLNQADDVMTWANAGPGCIRGLNRLVCRPPDMGMSQNHALEHMCELLELSKQYLGDHMSPWEMREVEHWSCEFSKYEKARLGEGRPRVNFIPPHLR